MIKKKICLLGAYAAGKTSLASRFVQGTFSERYVTTVGVKVDRKDVRVGRRDLSLVVWDIHGEDQFQRVRPAYLRGASGCLLVADGTRRETVEKALELRRRAVRTVGHIPFVLVLNKQDLKRDWDVPEDALADDGSPPCPVFSTSAKEDRGVEGAFLNLAGRMLES